eukprot:CAMPEP_0204134078 /NCGR_PEP_ID=MMETSP0361-20130328/15467_1 /ASSEMBLY_ACC=CAM_ASM_000343 /TAXON_ID=268821 /ORGANISM="Scrippsiella Hangoei, Strain SHTV-5" /LENGTH=233 /DNA_ID=CAMNT_0051087231 /DNA_START=110 /DNA_END=808 /DNA_ORIENTATION=+
MGSSSVDTCTVARRTGGGLNDCRCTPEDAENDLDGTATAEAVRCVPGVLRRPPFGDGAPIMGREVAQAPAPRLPLLCTGDTVLKLPVDATLRIGNLADATPTCTDDGATAAATGAPTWLATRAPALEAEAPAPAPPAAQIGGEGERAAAPPGAHADARPVGPRLPFRGAGAEGEPAERGTGAQGEARTSIGRAPTDELCTKAARGATPGGEQPRVAQSGLGALGVQLPVDVAT